MLFSDLTTAAIRRTRHLLSHGAYIPTEYYVIPDKQLIYISIPKVACTSIKAALLASGSGYRRQYHQYMDIHTYASQYCRYSLSREHRSYYRFAFVRNPLERLVSCYEDKVRRDVQHTGRYYFATSYNNILIRSLFGDCFRSEMSFKEFVTLVAKIPDRLADGHFKSQYSMLYRNNRQIPEYIGHFERLEADWKPLADKYGLDALEHKNPSNSNNWRHYFSDKRIIELAAERYRKDLEAFGYGDTCEGLLKDVPCGS